MKPPPMWAQAWLCGACSTMAVVCATSGYWLAALVNVAAIAWNGSYVYAKVRRGGTP